MLFSVALPSLVWPSEGWRGNIQRALISDLIMAQMKTAAFTIAAARAAANSACSILATGTSSKFACRMSEIPITSQSRDFSIHQTSGKENTEQQGTISNQLQRGGRKLCQHPGGQFKIHSFTSINCYCFPFCFAKSINGLQQAGRRLENTASPQ